MFTIGGSGSDRGRNVRGSAAPSAARLKATPEGAKSYRRGAYDWNEGILVAVLANGPFEFYGAGVGFVEVEVPEGHYAGALVV